MQRRTLLLLAGAGLLTPTSLVFAGGGGYEHYSRSAYNQARASGKPLLLDFTSSS